jgi:hypothetical protein
VPKYGGEKALTKHLHEDALKSHLTAVDVKVEVVPELLTNPMVLAASNPMGKPKGKMKVRIDKTKVTAKRSRLEKATHSLYDLEDSCGPEKVLNIDLGLYQMEDY